MKVVSDIFGWFKSCDHDWHIVGSFHNKYNEKIARVYCPKCDTFNQYLHRDAEMIVKACQIKKQYDNSK